MLFEHLPIQEKIEYLQNAIIKYTAVYCQVDGSLCHLLIKDDS